jgi:hypothetical protein
MAWLSTVFSTSKGASPPTLARIGNLDKAHVRGDAYADANVRNAANCRSWWPIQRGAWGALTAPIPTGSFYTGTGVAKATYTGKRFFRPPAVLGVLLPAASLLLHRAG